MTHDRILIQLGRAGDLINVLPLAWADAQAGKRTAIMTTAEFAPILEGCSYVTPIIFPGKMAELDKAMRYAATLSKDVVNCQLVGPREIVKNIVEAEGGTAYKTSTESFLKDQWVLAGRYQEWRNQYPLVFDQRDEAREAKLLEQLQNIIRPTHNTNRRALRPILVSASGVSSPFPYRKLLFELLRLKFWRNHAIISLDQFKAERLYDLLGIFERSVCLVSTDSAPLHLAYACSRLPVVALANDKPSLWHGSVWRPNHICHIRYSDFPSRAVEMLEAIDNIRAPGSPFCEDVKQKPKIVHLWSQYELTDDNRERNEDARHTWQQAYLMNRWVACPIEVGAQGRDTANVLKDKKRYPFLKEIIRMGLMRCEEDDVLCLTRSDTAFGPGLTEALLDKPEQPKFAHRSIQGPNGKSWHPVVDLFAFTKGWWEQHRKELPEMVMGMDRNWPRILAEMLKGHGAKELKFSVYRSPGTVARIADLDLKAPRLTFNESVAKRYLSDRKIVSAVPPVSRQVELVPINPAALPAFGYNPSLITHNGKWIMSCRWHPTGVGMNKLVLMELDSNFNVTASHRMNIAGNSIEDCRLFRWRDELWMSFVDSTYPKVLGANVKYAKLDTEKWEIGHPWQVQWGQNQNPNAVEKNWVFFGVGQKLFCIYQSRPKQIVIEVEQDKVVSTHETEGPFWPWGEIRGGTAPLLINGKLLRFFHSSLDNEVLPYYRRYYIGAHIMEAQPPFKTVKVSHAPILRGCEVNELQIHQRASCVHYKPQVVFPCGAVALNDGTILLSFGENDSACRVARLKDKDLRL